MKFKIALCKYDNFINNPHFIENRKFDYIRSYKSYSQINSGEIKFIAEIMKRNSPYYFTVYSPMKETLLEIGNDGYVVAKLDYFKYNYLSQSPCDFPYPMTLFKGQSQRIIFEILEVNCIINNLHKHHYDRLYESCFNDERKKELEEFKDFLKYFCTVLL